MLLCFAEYVSVTFFSWWSSKWRSSLKEEGFVQATALRGRGPSWQRFKAAEECSWQVSHPDRPASGESPRRTLAESLESLLLLSYVGWADPVSRRCHSLSKRLHQPRTKSSNVCVCVCGRGHSIFKHNNCHAPGTTPNCLCAFSNLLLGGRGGITRERQLPDPKEHKRWICYWNRINFCSCCRLLKRMKTGNFYK